ncbi:hypothetical protein L6452_08597 [Arctium lappa]|uniref:Uncharacterized protein n=1 Tax=Arctium lappa TaxID=4217 RepID=A0ACB9DHP9_ARCLA|nr:hypothetical protein L6452_08597 [Arctium lappa]
MGTKTEVFTEIRTKTSSRSVLSTPPLSGSSFFVGVLLPLLPLCIPPLLFSVKILVYSSINSIVSFFYPTN